MQNDINNDFAKIRRLQNLYNIIPNLLWSLLSLVPISIFCYEFVTLKLIYIFLGVSASALFLPNTWLDSFQVSNKVIIYKKLGISFIKKFSQNGDIINQLIKRKFPDHKIIRFNSNSAKKLISQTYMFEKFHLMLFIFFSLVAVLAIYKKYLIWAIIITLTNFIYNIYPNLLQQYIRVKLQPYIRR